MGARSSSVVSSRGAMGRGRKRSLADGGGEGASAKRGRGVVLPRRSPRRKSALTEGLYSILDVVLGRGTDASSLANLRTTCRAIRQVLIGPQVATIRHRERAAHVVRCLPRADRLVRVSAVLADNGHLQLDEGLADVASLTGSWDQYVVNEGNWRARWPRCRGKTLRLAGKSFEAARRALTTRWAGIHDIESHAGQIYVDEGACVRFEFEMPRGISQRLLGVELLSSRWTLSPEMREDREIRTLRDLDASEAPIFRLYHASEGAHDDDDDDVEDDHDSRIVGDKHNRHNSPPRKLAPVPGETTVDVHRSPTTAHGFRCQDTDLALDNFLDEWTLVYKVKYTLDEPQSVAGKRVVVEIDCRDHDCNAAVHNIFFNLAF